MEGEEEEEEEEVEEVEEEEEQEEYTPSPLPEDVLEGQSPELEELPTTEGEGRGEGGNDVLV